MTAASRIREFIVGGDVHEVVAAGQMYRIWVEINQTSASSTTERLSLKLLVVAAPVD